MKKNFFIFFMLTRTFTNKSNVSEETSSRCKFYDRIYEYFHLTSSEKKQLKLLLAQSDEKYVFYSKGSDFFYPNITQSDKLSLKKICNNNSCCFDESEDEISSSEHNKKLHCTTHVPSNSNEKSYDSTYISSCSFSVGFAQSDLDESKETLNPSNIKPLTVKNLRFHSIALKSHTCKKNKN